MLSTHPEVLFARSEHGSHPIRVVTPPQRGTRGVFEVLSDVDGPPIARYTSTKYLLAALTQNPHHGLTFDAYFGKREAHPMHSLPEGGSALDLFVPSHLLTVYARPAAYTAPAPVVIHPAVEQKQAALTVTPVLGIDLAKRGHEVRKLLFAGFGSRIMRHGYDPEEVLQEIFRGLLARNKGRCPFDVRKASFGHYVHMVCECILNNYHRSESRRREVEQVGVSAPTSLRDDAGETGTVDAASVAERTLTSADTDTDTAMLDALTRLEGHVRRKQAAGVVIDPIAVQVAGLLVTGMNRREIAQTLNVQATRVTASINALREHARDWL